MNLGPYLKNARLSGNFEIHDSRVGYSVYISKKQGPNPLSLL